MISTMVKMPTLKKVILKSEKELHGIIEKEIDAIEEGLQILKYEFGINKGRPDFLCVDSGGRIVIIEVKLQEDENILFQALRYYNDVDKERYAIAQMFSEKGVNPEEHPRIVLIASKFSDDLRRLCTLISPDIDLFEYTVLSSSDGAEGICYHPVTIPKIEDILSKPIKISDLKEYITKDEIKPRFDELINEIKNLGKGIEVYSTQYYVGFKFKGRQIAFLGPHRKSFDVGSVVIDENGHILHYDFTRVESGTEDCKETLEQIKASFENVGGKLRE